MTDRDKGGAIKIPEKSVETIEQAERRKLLQEVAARFKIPKESRDQRIDYIIINLTTLQALAAQIGYKYGMAAHRIDPLIREQIKKVGREFLAGAPRENDRTEWLKAGFNIFKVLTKNLDSNETTNRQ